ncbi:MAG: hypothetical protein ACRCYU_21995 [Nocardioides sp.]
MTPQPTLIRAGIVAAAFATGVLAAPVPPAAAAGNGSCSFGRNDYSCDTGWVTPKSNHQIQISAMSTWPGSTITCRAHDYDNGNQVGSVTSTTAWWRTSKTIGGLYGRYYLVCVGIADSSGEGSIAG